MKQDAFEQRHAAEWAALEQWLADRKPASAARPPPLPGEVRGGAIDTEAFPSAYRRLCQQLALARRRGYSALLLTRLEAIAHAGHQRLYRPTPPRWRTAVRFVAVDYPRLVRAHRGVMLVSALLFFGPLFGWMLALQFRPEWVYTVFSPAQIAQFEMMYDPAADRLGRESGSDLMMFGYYIMNNISIGFRTFASGLLAGLGSVIVLVMNGVVIGSVAGHLTAIGYGDPFWRFVAGHSGPELIAIVLAGGAGLQLGLALIAPGRKPRLKALSDAGWDGARLVLGVFLLLLFAAFVEAYWSSIASIPAIVKYTVGIALWTLIVGWLLLGGRRQVLAEGDAR